ncbi:MAG TPA: hypothetical protein VF476_15260 [Chitinophagaceae bacterium]
MQTRISVIKSLTVLFLVSFICFSSQAQQKESMPAMLVKFDQPDSAALRFTVFVANPENKRVSITVSSKNTGILHSESFTGNTYTAAFNMSQLEDGEYSIEVSSNKERVAKDISIETVVAVNRIAYLQNENKKGRPKLLAF